MEGSSSAPRRSPAAVDVSSAASPRKKIKTLRELADHCDVARKDGKTIVLAHGVFDVLHVGHVRHLEAAAKAGDILVVTVTADAFVNKGPDRPVFGHNLRAEMLAALSCVDWVAINESPAAEPVIRALRPDYYAKGLEYKSAENDISGKIVDESDVVAEIGGKVIFTDDLTFSSSALINKYLDFNDPVLKDYLDTLRTVDLKQRIHDLADEVRDYRVLLVGDSIIDEYQYVQPLGKSPKENMIATLFQEREIFAGGVIAAANHVANFCREVDVVTCIGGGEEGFGDLIQTSAHERVTVRPVIRDGVPTTRKCRFIDMGYGMRKLFEVYFMDDRPVDGSVEDELVKTIEARAPEYDLVIVTDFGHGLLTPRLVRALAAKSKFLSVNAQSNSANLGFNLVTKYPRADYVCIDQPEARLAVADNHATIEKVVEHLLPERVNCSKFIVTRGRHGCLAYATDQPLSSIPAMTGSIVDTVGAGDAFFAVSAPFVKAGATMAEAGFIGNAAGAMKVGIVGHRASVERLPLLKFVETLLK